MLAEISNDVSVVAVWVGVALAFWIVARMTRLSHTKLDTLLVAVQANHALLNHSMEVQLKISAVALRRVALLTGVSSDADAAEIAERHLRQHQDHRADDEGSAPELPPS